MIDEVKVAHTKETLVFSTLELAKTALQRLGSGFKYKRDDPDDPVQQALDAVDQYLPQSVRSLSPI